MGAQARNCTGSVIHATIIKANEGRVAFPLFSSSSRRRLGARRRSLSGRGSSTVARAFIAELKKHKKMRRWGEG